MSTNTKLAKKREDAYRIAGLICDELEKLPEKEQKARLKAIQNIKIVDRRSSPKRVSTQPSLHGRSRNVVPQRKRAHRSAS
jgi:Mg2+/Co2+ transporter CorB